MNRLIESRYPKKCIYIYLFLLLGFISSLAQNDSDSISPWEGKELFQKKGCIQCHSIRGSGGNDAPDLGEKKYYGTYLELASLMWNHVPNMIEKVREKNLDFPYLSEQETIYLLRYISYIRFWGEPGNERIGRTLLDKKKCTSCHKLGGKGTNIGPDFTKKDVYLSPLNLAVSMWNHLPEMMDMAKKMNIDPPKFERDEIIDLTSGIKSYMRPTKTPKNIDYIGNPENGEKIITGAKCLHCHSINGDEGKPAPNFKKIDFNYSVTEIAGIMWNHGSVMYEMMKDEGIEFPKFTKDQMADLIAFLYGINMESPAGDEQLGEKLINERGCLNCHKLYGKGADLAIDLSSIGELESPIGMISSMWNHAPAMQEKLSEKNIDWPHLDSQDMANLYEYLRDLSN